MKMRFSWCILAMAALAASSAEAQGNEDCLSFSRTIAPQVYTPGANMVVTVSFSETCTNIIAALGLVETIPPGWIFISAGGPTPPDTKPDVGDGGDLEFSWISSKPPFSFTYTIRPPLGEVGDRTLSGTAEYRVGTGSAQFFGPVVTPLDDGIVQCLDEAGCVSATHSTANAFYPPGAALQVTVSISETCTSPLQQLTIMENVPAAWSFVGATGAQAPTVQPAPGASGALTFSWLQVPALPVTFTYSVAVPAGFSGDVTLDGGVAWRTCETTLTGTLPQIELSAGESALQQCIAQCGTASPDGDGDRLNDCVEECLGTGADDPDTDKDGIADGVEAFSGLNPLDVADAALDLDRDGDSNLAEFLNQTGIDDVNDPAPVFYVDAQNGSDQGSGSIGAPWRTLAFALAQTATKGSGPLRLLLQAGVYTGDVTLHDEVAIIGLGACTAANGSDCTTIVGAVAGANGALLRNVTIAAADSAPEAVLLTMDDIAMEVDHVRFVGTEELMNTGILAIGGGPADAKVDTCRFEQLNVGIYVRDCNPKVWGSTFLDHGAAYIFFEQSATPVCGGSLGDDGDPNTGWNRFVEGTGLSVVNERAQTVVMERNDWDTNNAAFIAARVDGPVDFDPFLPRGSNLLAASFFATVTDDATADPIEDATVRLSPISASAVTANEKGVYKFAVIPEGSYTVTVSAEGYQTETMPVFVNRGGIFSGIFTLKAAGPTEGEEEGAEGEGEGEPGPAPGCQCPQPGKAVPLSADPGSLLVGLLSLVALVAVSGFQRRKLA